MQIQQFYLSVTPLVPHTDMAETFPEITVGQVHTYTGLVYAAIHDQFTRLTKEILFSIFPSTMKI